MFDCEVCFKSCKVVHYTFLWKGGIFFFVGRKAIHYIFGRRQDWTFLLRFPRACQAWTTTIAIWQMLWNIWPSTCKYHFKMMNNEYVYQFKKMRLVCSLEKLLQLLWAKYFGVSWFVAEDCRWKKSVESEYLMVRVDVKTMKRWNPPTTQIYIDMCINFIDTLTIQRNLAITKLTFQGRLRKNIVQESCHSNNPI